MNFYISDNKPTTKKKKGIYYLEKIPENAVIFGSTDLKKYNGGSADYLRVENHCFRIKDIIEKDSKAVGYIPVKRREIPLGSEEKAGYIQILDGFNPLFLLAFLTLLLILCLLILSKESDFIKKANIPSILKKNTITEETVEPIDKPEPTNYPELSESIETTDNKNDKNFLPKDSVFVPSDKKKVVQTNITESAKTEPSVVTSDNDDSKPDSSTEEDSSTPTPEPNTDSTDTLHVHTYVVEEQEATCTDLGFYKKYCKECGYVVADHTCAALGHTNSVASVSNMTYPEGMKATYVCDRCGETITDNFDYTSGLYKEDGSLLYTYDALEQVFDWNLSTNVVRVLMDAHTELADGRILVLPSWVHLSEVAQQSGKTEPLHGDSEEPCFSQCVLTEVILPDDTPYLGTWFQGADNIEKIELPDSITEYRGGIYSLNKLKYLKVSAGVSEINSYFSLCYNVETLIIPEGVTSIDGTVFPQFGIATENGMNVSLPSTLKEFGYCLQGSKISRLVIPGGVEKLHAISSISGMKEITFEEGITEIPDWFKPTSDTLKKLYFPSTLKKIGVNAFSGCEGLDEIVFYDGLETLGNNAFVGGGSDLKNIQKIILPNSIKFTGQEIPLINTSTVNLVVFPEEVDYFGSNAPFIYGGQSATSTKVIFPSIVHNYTNSIYLSFPKMEELVIPGGDYSNVSGFYGCSGLKKLTITGEITGMQGQFFHVIGSQLTDIYYYGSEESIKKVTEAWENLREGNKAEEAFYNATVHYMTGTPPTREDLMKEYGVIEGVYGLYSDETYNAYAEEGNNSDANSNLNNPVKLLQLSGHEIFENHMDNKVVKSEEHIHSLNIEEKSPTCTEDGYYRVICSTCGETLADHACKKRGHNMYMMDPENNTANIICPVFKCNRCDYTESTDHIHNWISKGYENMSYPDGGEEIFICAICLNKKTEHIDSIPGMYDENGNLMYTYSELEDKFDWNLSTTPAKTLMDDHTELTNGSILLLPSWKYLSKVAEDSGVDCGLIKTGSPACFQNSTLSKVILPDDCNDFGNWFCGSNVVELELPDSITDYKGYSVSGANKLQTLKLSAGAPDLSNFKAQGNPALREIIFPEGIEKIGDTTFAGNIKLKTVKLPSTLTDIGRSAFASSAIESLEIPANVKEIDSSNHSLAGMSKLKTLVLNDGLEKIDSYSFSSLGALENVYIPKSVTEMGTGIFSGLDNLENVTFQEGLTVIGDNLFQGCANLREIIIPNSIKNIPDNLFTGVANLNLIILPEELDSIGGDGLFSCGQNSDELKIIMPTTVKEWRSGAVFSSPKLKEIVLPGNVDFPIGLINNGCGLEKVIITSEPNSIAYGAFGNLHNADIYYYGSQESVQKFNAAAGGKDVFFQDNNSNRLHYMIGEPPTRKEQMDGIDYDNLEEISMQLNLFSNEETIILNEVEQTEPDFIKSVSDGNAE